MIKNNLFILLALSNLCYAISNQFVKVNKNFDSTINLKKEYFYHSDANSQIIYDSKLYDIFEYRIICPNKNLIDVKLIDDDWETVENITYQKVDKNIINISEPFFIRGTPIVKIQIFPWKITNENLAYLNGFRLEINYNDQFDISAYNYIPDYVINNEKPNLQQIDTTSTQYLILTPNSFLDAANSLKSIHSTEVDDKDKLIVEIVSTEKIINDYGDVNSSTIRQFLIDYIDLDINFKLQYILIFGDENLFPPHYHYNAPTDDYYTSNSEYLIEPQVPTGRIPISEPNEALDYVNQIRQYLFEQNTGLWKDKILLLADDENHPDNSDEYSHVINSNLLYEIVKDDLNITDLYSTDYSPITSDGWYRYPDLTQNIISNINAGVGILNYIGHGNESTLAHENLIELNRDINLINAEKQGIWIVGTCSFGYYDNNICLAEELLKKNNGSIAVISSTRAVFEQTNIQYLTRIFHNISNYINSYINNQEILRLGDLFHNSKQGNNDYLFQLFGDPALKINLPKNIDIFNNSIDTTLFIGTLNLLNFNQDLNLNYSMIIKGPDHYNEIGYYNSGDVIFQGQIQSNPASFFIPIDYTLCDTCNIKIKLFAENKDSNRFFVDTKNNFILSNTNFYNSSDNNGPNIYLWNNEDMISQTSLIKENDFIEIHLMDTSGINISNGLGHSLKYTVNDDDFLANDFFNFIEPDSGYFTIYLEQNINWPIELTIEAWDNLNNLSTKEYKLFRNQSSDFSLNKVYNFPNPFDNDTYFTFFSNQNAKITLSIFTVNGLEIFKRDNIDVFRNEQSTIYWDGKDKHSNKVPNGTYFYHITGNSLENNNQNYEGTYKLSKLK